MNFNDIDIPKDPILGSRSVRNIMGDRISPGGHPSVGSEEITVASSELDLVAFFHGFPLDGGVKPPRASLEDFPTGHAQEEGLVGGGEILVEAAPEADDVVGVFDQLHAPSSHLGGTAPALDDGLLVIVGQQVLVVMATKANSLGVLKQLHRDLESSAETDERRR